MSKLDQYNLSYNEIHSLFLENLGLWKSFRSISVHPNFNFFHLPTTFAVQKALTELSIRFNRLMNLDVSHSATLPIWNLDSGLWGWNKEDHGLNSLINVVFSVAAKYSYIVSIEMWIYFSSNQSQNVWSWLLKKNWFGLETVIFWVKSHLVHILTI